MAKKEGKAGKDTNFTWTDEETAFLIQVVIDYKAAKMVKGLDWETVKTKYDEIATRFQARYPKADSGVIPDEYPNCERPEKVNKAKIAPKIKRIKANFRKAVDSGKKSGGGRIVLALYDERHEIWSGSPAVESLPDGIESTSLTESNEQEESPDDSSLTPVESTSAEGLDSDSELDFHTEPKKNMGEARRNLVKHLQTSRNSKLTKRISADAHLLDIAKEEIAFKRKAMEKMDEADKRFENSIQGIANSMNSLTAAITGGFNLLQGMLNAGPYQQPYQHSNPYMQNYGQQRPDYGGQTPYTDMLDLDKL